MDKVKKVKPQLYLSFILRQDNDLPLPGHGDQAIIIVSVIYNDFEHGGTLSAPKWKNYSSLGGNRQYENLELRGYLSQDIVDAYGHTLAYWDLHEVMSKRAEIMAKTLKMIEKKFKSYDNFEGYYGNFGAMTNRLCRAIGAEGMIEWQAPFCNYDDCPNMKWEIGQIPNIVNGRIEAWHTAHPLKENA
jgi:hypothetical protein